MLTIKKDCSGKTYEYILTYKDDEIMQGDGFESEEEINEFLQNIMLGLNEHVQYMVSNHNKNKNKN